MFYVKITTRQDEDYGVLIEKDPEGLADGPILIVSRQMGSPKLFSTPGEARRAAKFFVEMMEYYNFEIIRQSTGKPVTRVHNPNGSR